MGGLADPDRPRLGSSPATRVLIASALFLPQFALIFPRFGIMAALPGLWNGVGGQERPYDVHSRSRLRYHYRVAMWGAQCKKSTPKARGLPKSSSRLRLGRSSWSFSLLERCWAEGEFARLFDTRYPINKRLFADSATQNPYTYSPSRINFNVSPRWKCRSAAAALILGWIWGR